MKQKAIKAIRELKEKRNYSLYQAIYNRNIGRMDNIAIDYRRNKITFREMFEKVDEYACSLTMMGYTKGSEILACVSNSPEFIYLLLAASKIGAKFNTIGEWFAKDYIAEIIRKNGSGRIFLSNDNYAPLKDVLEDNPDIEEIVMFSLYDSLPIIVGKKKDPFYEIDKMFKSFDDDVLEYQRESNKKIVAQMEFLMRGAGACFREHGFNTTDREKTREFFKADVDLEDDLLITYTSGSTDPERPKATLHPVKSLALLARFKESDVSGMPEMKDVRAYAHIPSYVLANISTSIIDPLYLGCTVVPEPIYDKEYFPYGLVMNKPNMSGGSVGFWRNLCKKLENNAYFKTLKMPYLHLPIVTGEAMGPGEEKFFNRVARKHKFGTAKLPFPLAPVTFSIGGGTNEITGIFVTLFRALQEKNPLRLFKNVPVGQTPLACADVDVVDEDGNSVKIGDYGEIIVRTECGMKGYYYDSSLDASVKMTRKDGTEWYRMGAYGVKLDDLPHVQIKGRLKDHAHIPILTRCLHDVHSQVSEYRKLVIKNEVYYVVEQEEYPLFKIDDIVARDTKNVLSSSVTKVGEGEDERIVIHVEPQGNAKIKSKDKLEESIVKRLAGEIPWQICNKILIRVRSTEESFPIAPSGKRDVGALVNEGIELAVPFEEVQERLLDQGKALIMAPVDKLERDKHV